MYSQLSNAVGHGYWSFLGRNFNGEGKSPVLKGDEWLPSARVRLKRERRDSCCKEDVHV